MKKRLMVGLLVFKAMLGTISAAYEDWQHSGSMYIVTTPEGANLPATASEVNFPVLVRLSKDSFDFSKAKAGGDDLRFSADGKALAFQIEDWDANAGKASIWVRIPSIKGNAQQEIRMFWGKPDAASESKGNAVFNDSNGYLGVLHMSDPVKDEVGNVQPKDMGTAASSGVIGGSRRFDPGKGINCGDKITVLPTGSHPHSTGVWFRPEKANANLIAWGNEQAAGKVQMLFNSPPGIRMDCYFSAGNVASRGKLIMNQWTHVVHTYKEGESRIYVNGALDGETKADNGPLNIRTPARMAIGGWYDNYQFEGEIDEVRLSKVTRSADWVKMEHENQKPMQTLIGSLVLPGSDFAVSEKKVTILEGKSTTVSAKAGGARKVYWIVKKDGLETTVDVDSASFTVDSGRVTGDQSFVLQFKAVYENEVKTGDIEVTIREDIPEPVFTLNAPLKWDGRETIEVVPQISNLNAMQDKSAANLNYNWSVADGAVIKEVVPGKLILKRSQYTGKITIKLALENGGDPVMATTSIVVKQPEKDVWVQRVPGKDEKPEDGQFYARDDQNVGTLFCNGSLQQPADALLLKLYADGKIIQTATQKPGADSSYAFTLALKPGLIAYGIELVAKSGNAESILHKAGNLVCGDAYLISGQSNALATDTNEQSPPETNNWIRSYGSTSGGAGSPEWKSCGWGNAVWKAGDEKFVLGWWGMELAKRLVVSQKVPICIIQAAVGGTRIDQHQRSATNHSDLSTIYGRMLWRVEHAKLTHGIKGVLWHQGESNQGSHGPTGDFDWKSYQEYFVEMAAAWKQDFPNIQRYYIFQIYPDACAMGGDSGGGDMIREKQRTLPRLFSNMECMSTLGITPPGGCHYPLVGWGEFARLMQPLIERDFYGRKPTASITAPNLRQAFYANAARDAIALEFDQPVVWKQSLADQFYLAGDRDKVASGTVVGNVVTLKLKEPADARKITYLKETKWSQESLLMGANGIAALTFAEVDIESERLEKK